MKESYRDLDKSNGYENTPPDPNFASAREERNKSSTVPDGYIPIELSTKGRLYAPAKFHMRNFSAEDLLGIALTDDESLPIKVVDLVNDLIYEDNVDIGYFHEAEVVETLFNFYKVFYSSTLKDVPYTLTEEDYQYLKDTKGGEDSEEYQRIVRDIKSKRFIPKFSINLEEVKTYELPEDFKPTAFVRNNRSGFTCRYGLPHYGDVRDLTDFIQILFKQEDEKFSAITRKLRYIQEQKKKRDEGEMIPFESIPSLTKQEEKDYSDYAIRRNLATMRATRAAHLLEYRGQDISKLPLEKKLTLADDPELDINVYKKISEALETLKIGLQKEIKIVSPITNREVMYPFTFRLFDLFQAISTAEPSGITVEFE